MALGALGRIAHGRGGSGERHLPHGRWRTHVAAPNGPGAPQRAAERAHGPDRLGRHARRSAHGVCDDSGGRRRDGRAAAAVRRRLPVDRRWRDVDAGERPASGAPLLLRRHRGRPDQGGPRVRAVLTDARVQGWRQDVRARLAAPGARGQSRAVDRPRRRAPHVVRQRRRRVRDARRRQGVGAHDPVDRSILYRDRGQFRDAVSHSAAACRTTACGAGRVPRAIR